MKLENLLAHKRSDILQRWLRLILETYPCDTSGFFEKEKDQFANPVGYTIRKEIETLFTDIVRGVNSHDISKSLDKIIRIRAVQNFSPSQAVVFLFLLKRAIREELESAIKDDHIFDEFLALHSRIDELALLTFDTYMKCREKIYEIRVNEVKRASFKLLERANLISDGLVRDEAPEIDNMGDTLGMNRGDRT